VAVQDVEVVVHAGGQQQVRVAGVPLQTPHAPAHRRLTEGLPHVPAVPQQHLLIVAEGEGGRREGGGRRSRRRSMCSCSFSIFIFIYLYLYITQQKLT